MKLTARISRDNAEWVWHTYSERKVCPLATAIHKDCYDVVRYLISHGADVHANDMDLATECGNLDIFRYVVENCTSVDYNDCLVTVCIGNHINIARDIIHHCNTSIIGYSAICAMKSGHYDMLRLLMENGAREYLRDELGYNLKICAIAMCRKSAKDYDKIVNYLKNIV